MLITLKEEEIKHSKEIFNARVKKLSPDVLSLMISDLTAKTKPQKLLNPSEAVVSPRMRLPANARKTTPDMIPDKYLAPHLQETFEQVARATMQELLGA